MKSLVVFLLVGTMMVLTKGFPEPEPGPEPEPEAKPTEQSEPEPESPDEDEHSVVKRAAGCPCGWRRMGSLCLVVNGPMKWTDAQRRCLAMGGNLLSVHNVHQNNQALSLLGNRRTWFAGSDAQEDRRWLNIDGTHFNYANWCPGEPNNHGGRESCAEMNFSGRRCWNDERCTSRLYSICARKVNS